MHPERSRIRVAARILQAMAPDALGLALVAIGLTAIYWPLAPIAVGTFLIVNLRLARRST